MFVHRFSPSARFNPHPFLFFSFSGAETRPNESSTASIHPSSSSGRLSSSPHLCCFSLNAFRISSSAAAESARASHSNSSARLNAALVSRIFSLKSTFHSWNRCPKRFSSTCGSIAASLIPSRTSTMNSVSSSKTRRVESNSSCNALTFAN